MLSLPQHITLVFILTTLIGFVISVLSVAFSERKALSKKATIIALLLMMWLIFQSTLALNGWYMDRLAKPPHILFPLFVNVILFILAFFTPLGRKFIDSISLKVLLWIHIIRIPVELCLYWLAQNKQVPWSMTFDGFNFDIIFGITAPIFILLFSTHLHSSFLQKENICQNFSCMERAWVDFGVDDIHSCGRSRAITHADVGF